jgi:uncharacterized damage-inducible protein DinB
MSEIQRIADQLKRAFEKDAWHGPSVLETLQGVTAEKAEARPVTGAHSIWEIVRHLTAWMKVVRRRVLGERVDQPEEGDWPVIKETAASDWAKALDELQKSYADLMITISSFSDEDLSKNMFDEEDYIYIRLHGIIQHNLYHAGQIAVLKKAITK